MLYSYKAVLQSISVEQEGEQYEISTRYKRNAGRYNALA